MHIIQRVSTHILTLFVSMLLMVGVLWWGTEINESLYKWCVESFTFNKVVIDPQ